VGCGGGAFTELLVERCAPKSVRGIDPSEGQLSHARTRSVWRGVQFQLGDAMALPFPDDSFDAAVMPLVIFFVPDPAKGVAEMARVVCPGGIVSAYSWDMVGGGFPYETLRAEMRALGVEVAVEPSRDASRMEVLQELWKGAGLQGTAISEITVERSFTDFDDFWRTILGGPSVRARLAAMTPEQLALLQARMRTRLPTDANGRISYRARANAIKGQVPI
jgi:ubiquinone/menaquinone biosynthesis C-methylase UbiE